MTKERIALWAFRLIVTLFALLLMSQPIWIGLFLQGQFDQLAVHRAVGGGAIATTWLVLAGAVAIGWFARLSWWPTVLSIVLFFALAGQFTLGAQRLAALHIPLGVLVIGVAGAIAFWSWLPMERHLRKARPPRREVGRRGRRSTAEDQRVDAAPSVEAVA